MHPARIQWVGAHAPREYQYSQSRGGSSWRGTYTTSTFLQAHKHACGGGHGAGRERRARGRQHSEGAATPGAVMAFACCKRGREHSPCPGRHTLCSTRITAPYLLECCIKAKRTVQKSPLQRAQVVLAAVGGGVARQEHLALVKAGHRCRGLADAGEGAGEGAGG